MNQIARRLELEPDEFAFYFHTKIGVDADALGSFLQRAATIARREGAEIWVIGLEDGSLAVKLKALKENVLYKNAKKEFVGNPIKSTKEASMIVGAVVGAIVYIFSGEEDPAPVERAAVAVHEKCSVTQIDVVTLNGTTLLTDQKKVDEIRARMDRQQISRPVSEYRMALEAAERGTLEGGVLEVDGELHFRPDGYRFLVPITTAEDDLRRHVWPNAHFRVHGQLKFIDNRPDVLIIFSAKQV